MRTSGVNNYLIVNLCGSIFCMVACEIVCVCNWELGVKLSTVPSSAYCCKAFD